MERWPAPKAAAEVRQRGIRLAQAADGHQWEKAEEHYRTDLRLARELLTEAVAMYHEIGMPKHQEMGEAMLGEV